MNTQFDGINSELASSSKQFWLKRANILGSREEIVSVSIIIAVFITMIIFSFHRWTGMIIDSGREMDLPLRLLRGEMLYRDVYYLYPPLSPYFNALLYKIFGAHLNVLQTSGIFFTLALTALSYRISRRILSPYESAIAVSGIVIICIFKPGGNLIQPYAYAALLGTVLAQATLLSMIRYVESRRNRELILAGILLGLTTITKIEFALAGFASIVGALFYIFYTERDAASKIKKLFFSLSTAGFLALLISLPVYGWLFYTVDSDILIKDCHLFYTHLPQSLVMYNLQRTGMDRPLFSLLQLIGGGAVLTSLICIIASASLRRSALRVRFKVVLLISLCVIAGVAIYTGKQWDGSPFRALPLLLIALIVLSLKFHNAIDGRARPYIFVIAIYSIAILGRVSLRVPTGGAFGGYFLPTSIILFCYLFFHLLPEYLRGKTNDKYIQLKAKTIAKTLFIIVFSVVAIVYIVRFRKNYTYEINAPNGHAYVSRKNGPALEQALAFIQRATKPGDPIATFSEGSDLAFLTGRRMPLRIQIYHPEFMNVEQEKELANRIKREGIRYIFIVDRPMTQFGAVDFGTDYYQTFGKWMEVNCDLVYIFGSQQDFYIKVYEVNNK